jgi:hypothetical protein
MPVPPYGVLPPPAGMGCGPVGALLGRFSVLVAEVEFVEARLAAVGGEVDGGVVVGDQGECVAVERSEGGA